ncbi:hypothetical protein AALP_AA3G354500 [Arabis alpina]|uniref:GDSL esterase/lipase n=1 Tax=Arabis alpina TaxID=50452 RepID=A0A087HDS8_ARAAL|nr:hypothetical protein AALP_AA3G354500 [Arabis alpina]
MAEGMFKALLYVFAAAAFAMAEVASGHRVPCYFVFGDSVFDNGNNNNLKTLVKVNHSPYGIGLTRGPTGRFSDGRNIPDFFAELMGFSDSIPPFTGASLEQAHTGLNYASGGGGLRDETPYTTSRTFTYDQYADSLIRLYRSYLKSLYALGARNVAVFGVSKLGCTPRMIASHGGGLGCATEVNKAVEVFNKNLKALVDEFNNKLNNKFNRIYPDAKFTFVDLFSGQNLIALGFKVTDKSCCTVAPGQEFCVANKPVCTPREGYMFWDNVHSTEPANMVIAKAAFVGLITCPYSIALLSVL